MRDEFVEKLHGEQSAPRPESNGKAAPKPQPRASSAGELPENFAVYYDQMKKAFWVKNGLDQWMMYSESQLSRRLRVLGVKKTFFEDRDLHLVEALIDRIMQENSVDYAGEMAGYPVGTYEILGNRVLITRGPSIPKPAKVPFPTVTQFLDSLLGSERKYFDAWMKAALLALKAGSPFRPGQVLGIAGPPGCGKSLLQDIITEILGGRTAKPYRYLIGDTSFNSDLFRAEHLVIEDEPASVDSRARRHFAGAIKTLCVNRIQSFHPKGKEPMSMSPFWRVSISVNDDQDHLMVLPPLDDSLADKVILLRASPATFPFGTDDLEGRKAFRQRLSQELPGYLYWLRAWRMPASLHDQRYGCVAYQNDDLKKMLQDLEPEYKLWMLIQTLGVIPTGHFGWKGTAAKLEMMLRHEDTSGDIARLFYFNTACGVLLNKLAKIHKRNVIKKSQKHGQQMWQIIVPGDDDF